MRVCSAKYITINIFTEHLISGFDSSYFDSTFFSCFDTVYEDTVFIISLSQTYAASLYALVRRFWFLLQLQSYQDMLVRDDKLCIFPVAQIVKHLDCYSMSSGVNTRLVRFYCVSSTL